MTQQETSLRERLILEGINELNEAGFQNFSLRRVAERCHVSCAAPYRHFSDKLELLAEILQYINRRWTACLEAVIAVQRRATRDTLVAVSLAYIRFLRDNPKFRAIIMQYGDTSAETPWRPLAAMSRTAQELVNRYCAETGLTEPTRSRKIFVVRSLIYGAAMMLDNGELPATEETMQMIAYTVEREFDLP